jgi:phage terminase small subunit
VAKRQDRKWGLATDKQVRFVEEYLIDLNATQAAKRAGYSEQSARRIGTENVQKPDISAAIELEIQARGGRAQVERDRVVLELARIAFTELGEVCSWTDKHVKLVSSDKLTPEQRAAIAEVSETQHGLKIKMHSKTAALDMLAKHLGMFVARSEISGPGGAPIAVSKGISEDLANQIRQKILGVPE